jgi:CSLREA domain-containing protein
MVAGRDRVGPIRQQRQPGRHGRQRVRGRRLVPAHALLRYQAGLAASGPATIPSATLTVNSSGDRAATNSSQGCKTGLSVGGKPECTLRAAIQTVNVGKGDAIDFDIAGGGTPRIELVSSLPKLVRTSTIDGTTQAGGIVEVSGTTNEGLVLAAPTSRWRGLRRASRRAPSSTG